MEFFALTFACFVLVVCCVMSLFPAGIDGDDGYLHGEINKYINTYTNYFSQPYTYDYVLEFILEYHETRILRDLPPDWADRKLTLLNRIASLRLFDAVQEGVTTLSLDNHERATTVVRDRVRKREDDDDGDGDGGKKKHYGGGKPSTHKSRARKRTCASHKRTRLNSTKQAEKVSRW